MIEPQSVEFWVELDYFPHKKCLVICHDKQNYLGEAKLLDILGETLKSV